MKPLQLQEHPEGGRFQEVFRSVHKVQRGSDERSALTHIYFELKANEVSRFHRVESDEIWNLYEGKGLILHIWDEQSKIMKSITLSAEKREYCHVVPAGCWQAAEPLGSDVLVGCSVAPGFEFEDFQLIEKDSAFAQRMLASFPELQKVI